MTHTDERLARLVRDFDDIFGPLEDLVTIKVTIKDQALGVDPFSEGFDVAAAENTWLAMPVAEAAASPSTTYDGPDVDLDVSDTMSPSASPLHGIEDGDDAHLEVPGHANMTDEPPGSKRTIDNTVPSIPSRKRPHSASARSPAVTSRGAGRPLTTGPIAEGRLTARKCYTPAEKCRLWELIQVNKRPSGSVIWKKVRAGFASDGIQRTDNAFKRVHEELKGMTAAQRNALFFS
jgi:hypothetical protein